MIILFSYKGNYFVVRSQGKESEILTWNMVLKLHVKNFILLGVLF